MNKQRGFTLVEAAVAIGVVGILSGIIIPMVLRNIRSAQIARAKNDIHVLAAAMAAQLRDTGTRPVAAGGPGGATGVAHAVWCSDGAEPYLGPPALPGGGPVAVP
ncbi:MAG: type II secretion system protein, partial [Holophaga sp.]|nr:type II secretion system protein [Holophaga sp.]